jgi:hypothetical protein
MRFLTDDTNSISNCKIPASVGAPIKRPSVKEKNSPRQGINDFLAGYSL